MAHQVSLKRMFRDPFRPENHTYYLVRKGGEQEHLCNLTHEYNRYHGRRMWNLDPIAGPSDKYPTKAEAIKDAVKYLARKEREYHGTIAADYLKERGLFPI